MKVGIMQPYFFPYIGYWQLMNAVDTYVIYDDVNYIKSGWINRNRILINGIPNYFNIELKEASSFKKINEINVRNDEKTKLKMLKTLECAYKKAPYFNDVFPILYDIIMQEEDNLSKYLIYSIRRIAEYLDMKTKFVISSDLKKNNELKGQDKVINICEILQATEYYNAIGGQELYDYETFEGKNIELKFLQTNPIIYTQLKNEFIPNLSIIDVMMFNDVAQIKKMLEDFSFITMNNEKVKRK